MSEPGGDFSAYGDAERTAGQKSPDAFRTISEVSADLDVPQHVLRFWEGKFAQIRPLKRGGGRRYYRPDDMDLLRGIQHLLYGDGYTIKGVQKLLREHGVKYVVAAGRRMPAEKAKTPVQPAAQPEPAMAPPARAEGTSAAPAAVAAAPQDQPAAAQPALAPPAGADRVEAVARLFGKLKALRRDYDLKLQAAKNGR